MTGLAGASPAAGLLEAVQRELADRPRPRVALLARRAQPPLASRLLHAMPDVEVVVLVIHDQPLGRLHARLTSRGPYDAVVDLAGGATEERLRRFLFHARPGGAYVVRTPGGPGFVVTRNEVAALALVHDRVVNPMLGEGRLSGEVLHTVPAQPFTSTSARRFHGSGQVPALPTSYDAPALHLRRWDDVVCLPRQIAIQSGVLLPASYAVRTQKRLGHLKLEALAPGFMRAPAIGDTRSLTGSFYYLDNQMRGHFGHALAEQVPVTWGWERARSLDPSIRALVGVRPGTRVATWELDLLEAAGIPRERVDVIDGPVRVERLVTATPSLSRTEYIHPESARTYGVIGQGLAQRATDRDWPSKVFLTRAPGNRTCRNVDEVEELHRRHGFEIVLPEELSLADQARLVREADVISGFAGSGMFQIAFAGGPKHVVAISSESYHVHNEQTFADLLGHRLDVIWCRAEVPRGERFDPRSFQSAFTFDFDREGRSLDEVLAGLG